MAAIAVDASCDTIVAISTGVVGHVHVEPVVVVVAPGKHPLPQLVGLLPRSALRPFAI